MSLAVVCDIQASKAQLIAEEYGVPFYTDMHDMMKCENVDVVTILTESGNHAVHAIQLAAYGKHLIVEKPMALRLEDADRMIEACDRNRCKLFVVKQNRFNVPVVKLRDALDTGRFGKLVMGTVRVRWCRTQDYYDQDAWRGTWALDGGVLANQASHHVDLLQWMLGDVESVSAISSTALAKIETEDTAAVILRFTNGALGIVEATTATRPQNLEGSLSIMGETGSVEIGGFAVNEMKTWSFTDEKSEDKSVLENYSVNPPDVYGYGHKAYYEHVAKCIHDDSRALVDGFEGRRSLELISAIYESIETRKEVPLRFIPHRSRLGH
jgi:predicted dehydrogenase